MRGSAPRRAKTMHKQLHSPQPITHSTPQPAAQTPQANPRRLSWSPRRRSLSAAHTPSQPSHRAVGPKDPTNVTAAPRLFNFRQESVVGIKRIQQYLGGVTVTNTGADVQDIATLIGRTQGTKPGGAAGGSAGMVGFDDRMFQREETESADVANLTFTAQAERNPKQDILLEALGQEFEVSTPLGNLIPFFMQDKTYMRNTEFDVRFVVSSHFDTDMLVTKAVPATARNRGIEVTQDGTTAAIVAAVNRTVPQLLPAIDAAGANTHKIVVTDCFIDACFATPSAPLPPLRSMQIPFSDITLYTRPLAANQTSFTETFSGIPPSTSAVIVALRSETHGLAADRERYLLGGSGTGFKNFQLTAGQFVAPQPSYNLNFPNRNASRAMADFVDFVGGSARDGAGAFSYNEYCDAPILCFRLLQPKGTYSPTATARIELLAGAAANTTLLVACVHQRALEMFWADGGDLPTQVTVDEVIA